jgi:hypothetical protein
MNDQMETTEILTYYNRVLALSRLLLARTESIMGLAQKGQVELVAAGIEKRQDVIDQLKALDKRFKQLQKIQKGIGKSTAPQDKNGIQSCAGNIRKTIERVRFLDLDIKRLVHHELKRVVGEKKKVSTNHAIVKKYVPSRMNAPEYFSLSI